MALHNTATGIGPELIRAGAAIDLAEVGAVCQRIAGNIERVVDGKSSVVRLALAVLLAEGHLLIEDVPGVGKTTLAKALARSIDCTARRIQFTPDLLPGDITGVSVYNQETRNFEFKPGPVFANLVVGDEINRASPQAQSALLESMEEHQVTVDGVSYPLPAPFMVIATQNPIEMAGTYPLPESQRDRFTARVSMGYPEPVAEMRMLSEHAGADPMDQLRPVSTGAEVRRLIAAVRAVHVSDAARRYAVDLLNATRQSPELRLGGSPRATLQLLRVAKAQAALSGRHYVVADDLQQLAVVTLAHRLLPTEDAQFARRGAETILGDLLRRVPVPRSADDLPPGPRG